tara:strand:- start:584 stop:724 length:141 start_codon:yes stop_codon:yes gene_type:complete
MHAQNVALSSKMELTNAHEAHPLKPQQIGRDMSLSFILLVQKSLNV